MQVTAKSIFGQQSNILAASNRIETVLREDPNYTLYLFELPMLEDGKFYTAEFWNSEDEDTGLAPGQLMAAIDYNYEG